MKIYPEIFLLIVLAAVFGYLFFYYADILFPPRAAKSPENSVVSKDAPAQANQVCFGKNCFSVQLAKTDAEREKGLMFVKQLDKDSGMFFIFGREGVYPFWMKNTLIPLDMIWINSANKVVYVAQNVLPCKTFICPAVNPYAKALYVLEINAGISRSLDIKAGDEAKLSINNK